MRTTMQVASTLGIDIPTDASYFIYYSLIVSSQPHTHAKERTLARNYKFLLLKNALRILLVLRAHEEF